MTERQHKGRREREAKAGDEHIPEGEVIYRAVRQDGDDALGESSASGGEVWADTIPYGGLG